MPRFALTLLLALAVHGLAGAHFVFVLPDADGQGARVVFSDELAPDENVDVAKIAGTTLTARDGSGKDHPLKLVKLEHAYQVKLPGKGPWMISGTTEYGVLAKGPAKPFLLRYHPRALVGTTAYVGAKPGAAALEVVPSAAAGGMRFQVLAAGKPAAGVEVTVLLPGKDESQKVKTDGAGFTPAFKQTGRFGLWARHVAAKSGSQDGKKYEEVRDYATLVLDVPAKPTR
jgi:uncharacterized GH25 family protein